jgi:hypothetical protein
MSATAHELTLEQTAQLAASFGKCLAWTAPDTRVIFLVWPDGRYLETTNTG